MTDNAKHTPRRYRGKKRQVVKITAYGERPWFVREFISQTPDKHGGFPFCRLIGPFKTEAKARAKVTP